jgi:hypothetical protein
MPTIDEKLAELRKTGIGEDVIAKMLTLPEKVKEEAEKLGLSFKEIADEEVVLLADTGNLDDADVVEINGRTFKAFGPPKPKKLPDGSGAFVDTVPTTPLDDTEPDPNDPNEPAEIAAGEAPEDVGEPDISGMADAIGSVVAQQVLAALGPALDLEKKLADVLTGLKTSTTGMLPGTTKEQHDLIQALTAMATQIKSLKDEGDAKTEADATTAKEIADLKATITTSQQQLADAQSRLKALEGEVPAGIQPMLTGYRASQDAATTTKGALTGPTDVQKPETNGHAPFLNDFITSIMSGKPL